MNLYVDVGNSRIKWNYHKTSMAADSLALLGEQWSALQSVEIQKISGSCVRGNLMADQVDQLTRACFGKSVGWASSAARACGVTNAYTEPKALGVDRWVALIAARERNPDQVCIVVDAGTAITVDLLDASGMHRGGVILPGAKSMLDTLGRAEQLFPDAGQNLHELAKSAQALTRNTQDAVLAGIVFAVQGGVSAVIEQQAKQINAKIETLSILLTGGDSPMLKLDGLQTILVPDLVLDGLRVLAENRE